MRTRIGMSWWLAGAFALIAAITAVAVAEVFSSRSESAFRERAQELAAGTAVRAAISVTTASGGGALQDRVGPIADRTRLALFVFNDKGALLTPPLSRGVRVDGVPQREAAVQTALGGRRFVATENDVEATVVALPLRAPGSAVLLAYAAHPDLAAELGIVRDEIVVAAAVAIPLGALAGILVARLIAARLRRIAAAARAIETGRFDTPLRSRFPDELGELASTIGRMGERLGESFSRLETERDRLRRLLERLHQGVVTVDRDLRVEFANAEARWLLGAEKLTQGDELPELWRDFSLRDFLARLFEEDAPISEARVDIGDEHAFSVVGIPARIPAQSAILVITDVSERERRERAEREFVANAAHELRTPLTTIRGAVDALQSGAKDVPRDRDRFLQHIDREAGRLSRLARSLLVLARAQTDQQSLEQERVELRPLLDEVASSVLTKPGVELRVDCPSGLAVLADRSLTEQFVFNLVQNAARHTEEGRIRISAAVSGTTVEIDVEDTGTGIAPEERDRVFDRFYRGNGRSPDGFGLGLAIVRQAVRALGGTVEMESVPGVGTTAHVTLPAAGLESAA
jgi:signal transduction histidine kinase/HAMP domain-containing protein